PLRLACPGGARLQRAARRLRADLDRAAAADPARPGCADRRDDRRALRRARLRDGARLPYRRDHLPPDPRKTAGLASEPGFFGPGSTPARNIAALSWFASPVLANQWRPGWRRHRNG